ncbi:hypothetical protein NDU88_007113 [Pleurodeles waltl]|uniref:Uncharacterized protein n=1 Tax=Pleurodeles waltl TaxID=8319 RepID=A0AAV7QL37_PLEWA|nr:hypothetical protein NDU88_007113 [Pleurodeles waltl]
MAGTKMREARIPMKKARKQVLSGNPTDQSDFHWASYRVKGGERPKVTSTQGQDDKRTARHEETRPPDVGFWDNVSEALEESLTSVSWALE